jgi:hypothetical protein
LQKYKGFARKLSHLAKEGKTDRFFRGFSQNDAA